MLGHVGPRRGRCNVEDLVATDTEDLRVPQALPVLRDIDLEDGADIPGEDVSVWVTT